MVEYKKEECQVALRRLGANLEALPYRTVASTALVALLIFLSLFPPLLSAKPLVLDETSVLSVNLATTVDIFVDESGVATVETFIRDSGRVSWRANGNLDMNFGFQSNPVWLKVNLLNTLQKSRDVLIVVESPTVDYLDLYWVDEARNMNSIITGNTRQFDSRAVDNRNFVFPITIPAKQSIDLYLRAQESGSLQLPLSLWSPNEYFESYQYEQTKYALYFGILIALAICNLFLWLTVRSRGYIYYVLYIVSVLFVQASQTGIGSQFIWTGLPAIASLVVQVSVPFSVIFAALFGGHTLNLKKDDWVFTLNRCVIITSGVVLTLTPLLPVGVHLKLCVILGVCASFAFLMTGIAKWRHGDLATKLFTVAWFVFLFGTVIYGSTKLGLLTANTFTNNAMWVGSAIEGFLLSFSVGARINQVQREKLMLERQQLKSKIRYFDLEKTTIKAEAENKTKSEFIASFSHEVRNPISGVLGMANLLSESSLSSEQEEFVSVIKYSGQTLLNLMNNVLDYSKIEAGRMTVESVETDLHTLIDSVSALITVQARELGIDFDVKLSTKVPRYIKTDPIRITQILNNLLGNAMKFTDKGQVTIGVSVGEDQKRLRFEVADTGIGLNKEQRNMLFQSFQQADKSTTRKYGGTGLGLAICKQLVQLMEGEIGVESELTKGSKFWFEIPLKRAAASKSYVVSEYREAHIHLARMHVLVAEDNHVNQLILDRFLKKMGCEVTFAENGQIAVQQYQCGATKFDLVLMDYEMPKMDGLQASQEIRKIEKDKNLAPTSIIMLTAHSMPDTLRKLKSDAINEILIKPIDQSTLQALLARYPKKSEYLISN